MSNGLLSNHNNMWGFSNGIAVANGATLSNVLIRRRSSVSMIRRLPYLNMTYHVRITKVTRRNLYSVCTAHFDA